MTTQGLYINSIDECVNNIIDSFYLKVIESKEFDELKDFKYIFDSFKQIINKTNVVINEEATHINLNNLITDQIEYNKILRLFSDYLLLYIFFYIGTLYDLNDILDLLNRLNTKYPINFFKNQYLRQYSIYYKYISDYRIVLENYPTKNNDKDYSDVIESINTIDKEILENIASNKRDLLHNIIKIIIFKEIYIKEDKNMIFKILENEEMANAEYKYIEVIDTRYDTIDYAMIENLFDINDRRRGLAEEIYNMINDYEALKIDLDNNVDVKINQLFKKKILIPITDEFLRFHKDTEQYDKSTSTKIDPKEKVIKKGDTKIRYIVTKINKVKDYYSAKVLSDPAIKTEIEKNFYQPLFYRKAIIINDLEEINILKKLELQGKSVTESNEFYEELKQIRSYPYIEFKSTSRDNISFTPDATINAIRYCNFEFKDDTRFPSIGKLNLQTRIINNFMKAHIVGVAMPRFNILNTNEYNKQNQTIIQCHTVNDTMNIVDIKQNSFKIIKKKLRQIFLENKEYSKLLYWLFDRKNDIIKTDLFDNIYQLSTEEYIKVLLSNIYDEMIDITYTLTLNKLNTYDIINIDTAKNILRFFEDKLVMIPRLSYKYDEIMKLINYMKININVDKDDNNENKIPGVTSKLIKLPHITLEKIAVHIIKISKEEIFNNKMDESDIYEGYLCQHIITWKNLLKYKKSNPNKFNQELYNFIKKYVTANIDGDFVCKSCYQMVDLRKYTTEIYPGSDNIAVSYGLETELETLPEYTKYTKSIKNIDKMLEKICYASNILYYVGSGQQIKFRRQEIIKNIIDIIDTQYKTLFSKDTHTRKERIEISIKNYGCTLTSFFLFKLENDIFTYSSKEIDKFKLFKIDNILTYMLITLINELNLSQILYLSFDKLVNYFLFTKFGFNLFNDLYIRISNKNDLAPIKNYKLLCYIIYYLTGMYAKFNMWYADEIPYKPNNINPQIQRIAIHTFVDALNSILTISANDDANYIYNMFATKFYNKLNMIYNNVASKDIIDKLELQNKKRVIITADNKLKYNIKTVEPIPFVPYNPDGKFIISSSSGTKQDIAIYPTKYKISDTLIDKKHDEIVDNKKLKEINDKLYLETLRKIATLYGSDGIKRNIPISIEDTKNMSIDELKKISSLSRNVRLSNEIKLDSVQEKKIEKINMKNIKNEKYIEQLRNKYNIEIAHTIDTFVNLLESIIGKDININNNNYYLQHNVYEIDHDYRCNKKTPIIILEKDQIIKYKKNDAFFGQDVYQYEDTNNQVSVFYSATEKYLIGYKESSKEYIKIFNSNCYLKIHYSFKHQLTYLGFTYMNYPILNKIDDLNDFVNNILRIRLQNLKNSLSILQQVIYQVKNKFNGSYLNPIAKYYQSKIKNINTYDDDADRIFKDWSILNDNLYYNNIDVESIGLKILPNQKKFLPAEILLKFVTNDDIIIQYIIEQLTMLINVNTDNYIKVNISYMIINIIFQIYRNLTNFENAFNDLNVKKFYYHIINKASVSDSHEEVDLSTMTEEEIEKLKEERDIAKESLDALDADQDEINEDFGDEEVLLLDRSSGDY